MLHTVGIRCGPFTRRSLTSRPKKWILKSDSRHNHQNESFSRFSSPHFVPSVARANPPDDIEEPEAVSQASNTSKRNLDFPDPSKIQPYAHLPVSSRTSKQANHLMMAHGNFHCRNCNRRYTSDKVWITQTTRKCVQSVECESCCHPNKPYHVYFPEPSIFNAKRSPCGHRTRKGKWVNISPRLLSRMGY